MANLASSSIIVTGGYSADIAEAFVKAGARVWITGRDAARLRETATRIGATAFVADVADGEAWDRLMAEVLDQTGRLDVLINNAGEGVKIGPAASTQPPPSLLKRSISRSNAGPSMRRASSDRLSMDALHLRFHLNGHRRLSAIILQVTADLRILLLLAQLSSRLGRKAELRSRRRELGKTVVR